MFDRPLIPALACAALLASCAPPPVPVSQPSIASVPKAGPPPAVPSAPYAPPTTIDGYKREFARHVEQASGDVYTDPLPDVIKSIVVLDVTIARDGKLVHVAVYRSNGYKALENTAVNSVRRAAPFAPPSPKVGRRDGSVNFLETFLFRNDDRFRIQSLARAQ
jgi:protein TonB